MIPFFDYKPGYREIRGEIDAAIARVLDSGQLILGPEVAAFEREFAGYVGSRAAVGVNSGTDALILALRALGIGAGDEVLTVANAGVPPVAAIRAAGATPRFVDVLPGSLLMNPDRLEAALTPRTKCLLPVHLYGQPAPLGELRVFAQRHGLHLVEDCAQAHGARWQGKHAGTFGAVGCFSFYPTKNLGAFGDGGLCVTDDPALEERMRMLRMYGFHNDRTAHCEGLNTRLDELQAAILRAKLAHLDRAVAARRAIAGAYTAALAGSLYRPVELMHGAEHAFHLFVVLAPDRARAVALLERHGIGSGVHYAEPVHVMEAYEFLGVGAGELPHTEHACRHVLSLPLYPELGDDAVAQVVQALLAER